MSHPNPHGPSCPWHSITETIGAPNIKWCEQTLCQWISEPANTWSNLGYMIAACVIMYISFKHKHNFLLKQFGPIVFLLGMASFYYHMSNFYGSQVIDFVGMFLFVGWAIGMNLIRLRRLKIKFLVPFYLGYTLVFSGIMHWMYLNEIKFQVLIIISGLIILSTEIIANKPDKPDLKWFIIALLTFIVAFLFSASDHARIWCQPDNHHWFAHGHAVWHWISGLAMIFVYLHYAQPALHHEKLLKEQHADNNES